MRDEKKKERSTSGGRKEHPKRDQPAIGGKNTQSVLTTG
jgi:hypothetical protein